jgi:hypothetical protein
MSEPENAAAVPQLNDDPVVQERPSDAVQGDQNEEEVDKVIFTIFRSKLRIVHFSGSTDFFFRCVCLSTIGTRSYEGPSQRNGRGSLEITRHAGRGGEDNERPRRRLVTVTVFGLLAKRLDHDTN